MVDVDMLPTLVSEQRENIVPSYTMDTQANLMIKRSKTAICGKFLHYNFVRIRNFTITPWCSV